MSTPGPDLASGDAAAVEAAGQFRGTTIEEMDLSAVLRRQPQVALVDELAHKNVPGSGRNGQCWQDVLDLLAGPRAGAGLGGAQGGPDRAGRFLTRAARP